MKKTSIKTSSKKKQKKKYINAGVKKQNSQFHTTMNVPIKRPQNKVGLSFVRNLYDLKSLLKQGYYEYRIALGGTAGSIFSRKYIYYNPKIKKAFSITNCIDDSEQELTQKQLFVGGYSNIGKALRNNCLIVDLNYKI